jgi:hypothetical protein
MARLIPKQDVTGSSPVTRLFDKDAPIWGIFIPPPLMLSPDYIFRASLQSPHR